MSAYDYDLPASAIAQTPAEPRDAARLLVATDGAGAVAHRRVSDLPDLLEDGDLLVVNETRVLPARLQLQKPTGGTVEVLLLEPLDEAGTWEALVKPSRRLATGTVLRAGDDFRVEVGQRLPDGRRAVRLDTSDPLAALAEHGAPPLPPYIRAPLADPERYQTVYARLPGSVAAPTAGLHLTAGVLERCRERGVEVAAVDLSVGLDTFRPVTAERAENHQIHSERFRVPRQTLDACRRANRVVAIGTTTVRALESAAQGTLEGRTSLFIHGDYQFQVVDLLLTNFHLPRSSLLLLLAAFVGERWRDLYAVALAEHYRFLSFGDAMLVRRKR
ncbi:MAG: tRNA preQ1(34) S-adenosylmethionine ribosyltransferase-isomerase QueA [Acidimicrobiia bacterium]|nr:tRNA preQ1(34) S-adenosylmethionine ribosyltransferase-isomerase QueA [Acidimicrobiia bacterium]